MIDISEVIENYPYIANVLSFEWFESEIKKESNHSLIKQLIYDDDLSIEYLKGFEDCLELLIDEIKRHPRHFRTLRFEDHFENTRIELEIGYKFKKMGFNIELEPSVQNRKVSDIKINLEGVDIFIEVSTRIGPEEEILLKKENGVEIIEFKTRDPSQFSDKIETESVQLSKDHPGIVALYFLTLYTPEKRSIVKAFGFDLTSDGNPVYDASIEESIDYSIVSALLLSSPNDITTLWINPFAKNPLPDRVLQKFKENNIKIMFPERKKD
jgi:hypothetical protein